MKIYAIHKNQEQPCYVIKYQDLFVMFDCPLNWKYIENELACFNSLIRMNDEKDNKQTKPKTENMAGLKSRQKFDISDLLGFNEDIVSFDMIDILLISSASTFLALPFLCARGFKGKILMTEPTYQYVLLSFREIYQLFDNAPEINENSFKMNNELRFAILNAFCEKNVKKCLHKVELLNYNQITKIFNIADIIAISSGFSVGSCIWILKFGEVKISYISNGTALTSHCSPLKISMLKNSTLAIIGCKPSSDHEEDPDAAISNLCSITFNAIESGKKVVILPCASFGLVYDLLECFAAHLYNKSSSNKMKHYFIGPCAKDSLAIASCLPEWLSEQRAERMHLGANQCFKFNKMIDDGYLECCHNLTELSTFKSPAIIFACHPSLKFGPIVDLLKCFDQESACILTDPFFENAHTQLSDIEYQGEVHKCIIESRLRKSQLESILSDLNIAEIIDCNPGEVASLKVADNSILGYTKEEFFSEVVGNYTYIFGNIHKHRNHFKIDLSNTLKDKAKTTYGQSDINMIVNALKEAGFANPRIEKYDTSDKIVIYNENEDVLINVDKNSAHIIGTSDVKWLVKAKSAVLNSCKVL